MSTPLACRIGKALRYAVPLLALVILPSVASATQHAILISGFDDDTSTDPPGSPGFLADLSHVYVTLRGAGYTPENIQVLCADGGEHDLDNDTFNDVDGKCETQADVDQAFQALAGQVQPGDVVFFFATGHGMSEVLDSKSYPNTYVCTYKCLDKIWDYEVAGGFRSIDQATGGGPARKICIVVPCYSGGFVVSSDMDAKPSDQDLAGLSAVCAVTAVDYDQGSNFDRATGYPMTYWWTSAIRGTDWAGNAAAADANGDQFVSLAEAYNFAVTKYAGNSLTSGKSPQKFVKGCVLDFFTDVNGIIFPVPLVTIQMSCCPQPNHPWMAGDCYGHGLAVTPVAGAKGARQAATGTTFEATARLGNDGTAPSQTGSLTYYYRPPTLGLGFYDTGWQQVATQSIPPLQPGDSLTMSPVVFSVPDVNPFGEPFWTVAARVQTPLNPEGSGWLADDQQVKMVNDWTLAAAPGEPREIHFQVVNPSSDSAMVVLDVDRSGYPSEWLYQLSPPANDTLLFLPHEVRVATLTLQAASGGPLAGTLNVSESLLPTHGYGACPGTSCADSTCGGFIRVTGGCAVTLLSQGPTSTLVSLQSAEADPDRVRIAWICSGATGQGVTIYRRTAGSGWQALGSVSADGAGRISYEDREVVAGVRYGYRLGVRVGDGETYQGETWIVVPARFVLALQGLRPNPTQRDLAVLFSLPDMAPATLELLDVLGRRLVRREVGSLGPGNHVLNLGRESAIPAGVYLVRLLHGSQLLLAKGTVLR